MTLVKSKYNSSSIFNRKQMGIGNKTVLLFEKVSTALVGDEFISNLEWNI
jgi:hypothetical protein